jgi:hypothetical protein
MNDVALRESVDNETFERGKEKPPSRRMPDMVELFHPLMLAAIVSCSEECSFESMHEAPIGEHLGLECCCDA